jgi:hypothetical protein
MKFAITIRVGSKQYHMQVTQILTGPPLEHFRIAAANNPQQSIVLQSNRPLLRSRGLRHRRIDWKLVEGVVLNQNALRKTIVELEAQLERL